MGRVRIFATLMPSRWRTAPPLLRHFLLIHCEPSRRAPDFRRFAGFLAHGPWGLCAVGRV
jgi:hypothetical protein